jgi:hypothetical protein
MTEFEFNLFISIVQILPDLLKAHPYSIFGLAQECSHQLKQPLYEVMTPLTEALNEMSKTGTLKYDHCTHEVILA